MKISVDPISYAFVSMIRKWADKLSNFLNHPDRYEAQEKEDLAQVRRLRDED